MTPTTFEINLAVAMLSVALGLFAWLHLSMSAATLRRMSTMMGRLGLDAGITSPFSPRTNTTIQAARRRCRKCSLEGHCERWLNGDVGGSGAFCPNARLFNFLADS